MVKNRQKKKTELLFDDKSRVEFLSGFSKRKAERKKVAKVALQRKIKNELKRIRHETKEGIKKNCKSFEPIKFPQLGDSDQDEDIIEDDTVTVSVKTLGVDDLAQKHNWIGSNKGFKVETESEASASEEENETEEIQGMGLTEPKKEKVKKETEVNVKKFESKKDIDREMKKKTFKALKKNKAFKAKSREKRSKDLQTSRRKMVKNRQKKKTELLFDDKSRVEFLSGFSKRKAERKKVAKVALQRKIKNELKRIRHETKEGIKKNCKSFEPIKFPQLGDSDEDEDIIEDDTVTVSVKTLGVDDLAQKHNWIGSNKGFKVETESEASASEEENETEEIQGMGLTEPKKEKVKKETEVNVKKFESKKDIDREMKKKTFKALKKNKAFKAKSREKRSKDLQTSRRVKHFKQKTQAHSKKHSYKKFNNKNK
uniref:Nucleolar protein 12 n=1 Tax=Culicoides sonorensis TaxID=179676 RepID=A0A336L3A4_CULSO